MLLQPVLESVGRYGLNGPGGKLTGLTAGVEIGARRLTASAWRALPAAGAALPEPAQEAVPQLAGVAAGAPDDGGLPEDPGRPAEPGILGEPGNPVGSSIASGAGLATGPALVADLGGGLTLTLRAEAPPEGVGVLLTLFLTNGSPEPLPVGRLFPLLFGEGSTIRLAGRLPARLAGPGAGSGQAKWGVYKQGYQSWSYSGWRPLDGTDIHPNSFFTWSATADPTWLPPAAPGQFQSESMLILGRPDDWSVLLAGFATGARQLGRLELWSGLPDGPRPGALPAPGLESPPVTRLEAFCEGDNVLLQPGESVAAEPLFLALAPERTALDGYASVCGRLGAARVPESSPAVWCSWYYHFAAVRETDIIAAAEGLARLRRTHPVDVIQLDDGYEAAVGDWLTPNRKFPHGLPWLSERVQAAGFTAGLWLAPFIAARSSRLFRNHRDWFVQGPDGKPKSVGWNPNWRDFYYGLDTTHPEARAYVADVIRQVVAAGYRYLKLDFLFGAAVAGTRFDPGVTRAAALRQGLELVREAAGPDVFLLGCGSPMLPAVGIVDGMRVGPDVAADWTFKFFGMPLLAGEPGTPSLKNALRGAMNRQWMHGRLWANDPDSIILRDRESNLNPEEVRTLASVAGLSGGILSFSDPPRLLSEEQLDWLRRLLPATGVGFQPTTLLSEEYPLYSTLRQGDWLLMLVVNGSGDHRAFGLPPSLLSGDHHIYDCWAGHYLGRTGAGLDDWDVAPHGVRVLALRPARREPAVVGTTFHLNPAMAIGPSIWDGQTLEIRLAPGLTGRGCITVAVPFLAGSPSIAGIGVDICEERMGHPGELILTVEARDGGTLLIQWPL